MTEEDWYVEELDAEFIEDYRNVAESEEESYAYNMFIGLLEVKAPEESEISEFLTSIERSPEDTFAEGLYNAAIDYAEKKNYLPMTLT